MAIKEILCSVLSLSLFLSPEMSYAQSAFVSTLPVPGKMVGISAPFTPVLVKGLVIHPDQPLNFDFIVDSGNDVTDQAVIKEQSSRLAKYFLAAVTVPESQLWVNLSPYEKDRVIENELGTTELGRDMLAQDYLLKQLTASLIYPEEGLGKDFWAKVYSQAQAKFGTTDIPVDTFNKVWIMPATAEVFEKGNAVYVTQARLKVMLDSDYVAMSNVMGVGEDLVSSQKRADIKSAPTHELTKSLLREIILPAIEKEVNEGKNFAAIRQIYHTAILAKWYRELIQNTLLSQAYVGQNKVEGITLDEKALKEEIYQRYIAAYKKGVFDYIKDEDVVGEDLVSARMPRKYFSGGISDFAMKNVPLSKTNDARAVAPAVGDTFKVDLAMGTVESREELKALADARLSWLIEHDPKFATQLAILGKNLPGIILRKKAHVVNVYWFFYLFRQKQFETLYHLLSDKERDGGNKVVHDAYKSQLKRLSRMYRSLGPDMQDRLLTVLILHDIGSVEGAWDWTHHVRGRDMVKRILEDKRLGFEPSEVEVIADAVFNHGIVSNIGVDFLPEDFARFSAKEKDFYILMSFADLMANKDGETNGATRFNLDYLLGLQERFESFKTVEDKFLKYRFGKFFRPFAMKSEKMDNNYAEVMKELERLSGDDLGRVKAIWQNRIRVNMFGLFMSLGEDSRENFARLVYQVAKKVMAEDPVSGDIYLETEVDFMGLDFQGNSPSFVLRSKYVSGVRHILASGGDIPMHFREKDGQTQLVIELENILGLQGGPDAANGQDVTNGGIDIRNIDVNKAGSARIQFNDQAVRDVLVHGFNGFTPVIIKITPAIDPLAALGIVKL
ncbi:MAG: hypothetical protein HQL17_02250 [Candidatus Omnitrophica bacterium]|nr:hypothetical protein [Candidatus Omnitrophota bacterium]